MSLYFRSICVLRKMNGRQSLSVLKYNLSPSTRLISWGNCKAEPLRKLPSLLRRRHFLVLRNFAVPKSTVRTPKVKISRSEVRRILQLAKAERWRLTGAVVLLLISSVVTMAVPFCIGKVVDIIYAAEKDHKKGQLNYLTAIFILVFIIGGIAVFGRVYLIQTSGQRIVQKLRTNIFSSVINQELAFFDKHKTGELLNRLSADTTIVGQSVTQNVSDGLRALAGALASISMMVYMSPYLSLVSLCTVPPVAAIGIIYGKYVSNITKEVQDALAEVNQVAEERISNIRLVKAFAQEEKEKKYYFEKIMKVLGLQTKEALAKAAFFGAAGLSGNLIILTVLYSGGSMMADAQITVGELTAFLMYAAYLGVSLNGLSSFYSELMRGLAASTELWRIVDRIPVIQSKDGLIPSKGCLGAIQFQSITFSYPNRSNVNVFENLNLSIPAGSVTAIVGGSGSGKSTLGGLLLRYYDPQKGSVTVDGHDIRNLNLDWLRNNIGTVSQEPILFSCSIRDNILYGIKNPNSVTEELIMQAAKEANAYDFINSFPEKFDTLVGERGMMLSGGQRQRLAICRAIIKNPRILLLDEATSALDAESEHLVQEALERLLKNRTVITIAHRLSTIKNADQIAVLYNKQFAELGSYESLMKIENGMFRKLVEHQMISSDSKPQ